MHTRIHHVYVAYTSHIRIYVYAYMSHVRRVYECVYMPSLLASLARDLPLCAFLARFTCSRDMLMCMGKQR